MKISLKPIPLLLGSALLLNGCRDREIVTYEVPKEDRTPSAAHPTPPGAPASPPQAAASLIWDAPAGWQEKPATAMRRGSYTAGNAEVGEVDVSIFVFPDQAGGLLANVNRWRGQVGLDPIDQASLATTLTPLEVPGLKGVRLDLDGPGGTDMLGARTERILGAILSHEGSGWFFKMSGPRAAVEAESAAWNALVASIRPSPDDLQPRGEP